MPGPFEGLFIADPRSRLTRPESEALRRGTLVTALPPPLPEAHADDPFHVPEAHADYPHAGADPFASPDPPPLLEETGVFKPAAAPSDSDSFAALVAEMVVDEGSPLETRSGGESRTTMIVVTVVLITTALAAAVALRARIATVFAPPPVTLPATTEIVAHTPIAEAQPLPLPATEKPVVSAWDQEARSATLDLPPATSVVAVSWQPAAEGALVTIQAGGALTAERVSHLALASPPRELIRIAGIRVPFTSELIVVGGPELQQIRIGHHPELTPPQLYVVLDLASPRARIERYAVVGTKILVLVSLSR